MSALAAGIICCVLGAGAGDVHTAASAGRKALLYPVDGQNVLCFKGGGMWCRRCMLLWIGR